MKQPDVDLTGTIVDSNGHPIPGAKVTTIRTWYVVNDQGVTTETNANGHFRLPPIPMGPATITVTANGFAPDLRPVDARPDLGAINFALHPGQTLRGRIVDPAGNPIAGATIRTSRWRNRASLGWGAETDADGRFAMPDAPADTVMFDISADGHRYVSGHSLKASDGEATVTMRPQLKIAGRVTDAETGRPIDHFRVIAGHDVWERRPPSWDFRRPQPATNGQYDAGLKSSDDVLRSYVRIEADGYAPAISPAFTSSGTFDAQLRRAPDVTGTVRNPDGSLAANVEVHLVLDGDHVIVSNGTARPRGWTPTRTDEQGRFRFTPQAGPFHLIVFEDHAYAVVRGTSDHPEIDVSLTPWARVEGTYNPRGLNPAPCDATLFVSFGDGWDGNDSSPRFLWQNRPTPDAAGRYVVRHAPHFDGAPASVAIEGRSLPIRLSAGQTSRLDVLPGGVTIIGRIVPATPADAMPSPRVQLLLTNSFDLPADQWPARLGDAMAISRPTFGATCTPDGSFSIPAVPPGTYAYWAVARSGELEAAVSGTLDATGQPDGSTLDLGTLRYTRQDIARIGHPMPPELGQTFDGRPICLTDHAGKVIVLAVWDSCSGQADPVLPYLNSLGDAYIDNPRVALLSINTDPVSCGMVGIPKRPATLDSPTWIRGYVSTADQAQVARLGAERWPAILVVGADGRLVARDVPPATLADAVANVLR